MRFSASGFFHKLTPYGDLTHTLNFCESGLKFAKLFELESCSPSYDNPQNFIQRGIRPRRNLFRVVRYQPPGNLFSGVRYPA
jgi:hypothetical protein